MEKKLQYRIDVLVKDRGITFEQVLDNEICAVQAKKEIDAYNFFIKEFEKQLNEVYGKDMKSFYKGVE